MRLFYRVRSGLVDVVLNLEDAHMATSEEEIANLRRESGNFEVSDAGISRLVNLLCDALIEKVLAHISHGRERLIGLEHVLRVVPLFLMQNAPGKKNET